MLKKIKYSTKTLPLKKKLEITDFYLEVQNGELEKVEKTPVENSRRP